MSITEAFAGVAAADYEAMREWYERLFGRPPDMTPHAREACWRLTGGGWVYVVEDPERAGGSLLTLLVDDLDDEVAAIASRGIEVDTTETYPAKARKANFTDPEGNQVSFAQPL